MLRRKYGKLSIKIIKKEAIIFEQFVVASLATANYYSFEGAKKLLNWKSGMCSLLPYSIFKMWTQLPKMRGGTLLALEFGEK